MAKVHLLPPVASGESRFVLFLLLEFSSNRHKQHLCFLPLPPTAELRRFGRSGANSQPVREEPASGGQRQAAHLPGIKWDCERLRLDESVVQPWALSGEYFPCFCSRADTCGRWWGPRKPAGEQVRLEGRRSEEDFRDYLLLVLKICAGLLHLNQIFLLCSIFSSVSFEVAFSVEDFPV